MIESHGTLKIGCTFYEDGTPVEGTGEEPTGDGIEVSPYTYPPTNP